MTKRIVVGVLLAAVAALLLACQVEQEAEDTDVTPAVTAAASSTPLPNPTLPPLAAEQERLRQEEDAKPKFEGVVNGIRLYPTGGGASERKDACSDAKGEDVQQVTMDAVAGTVMEITPTYLPDGAEEQAQMWPPVVCKGVLTSVERWWTIRGKATFFIARRQGEQAIDTGASADRISSATVGGKRAAVVKPLTPAGYGWSMVIVAEDFGLTVIGADGLPLDETVKIAEGLR